MPGGVREPWRCATEGRGLVGRIRCSWTLDSVISEAFSNLTDSTALPPLASEEEVLSLLGQLTCTAWASIFLWERLTAAQWLLWLSWEAAAGTEAEEATVTRAGAAAGLVAGAAATSGPLASTAATAEAAATTVDTAMEEACYFTRILHVLYTYCNCSGGKGEAEGQRDSEERPYPLTCSLTLPPAACRLPAAGRRRRGAAAQASAPGGRAGSGTRCGAGGGGLLASAATAARRALTSPPPEPVPPSGRRAAGASPARLRRELLRGRLGRRSASPGQAGSGRSPLLPGSGTAPSPAEYRCSAAKAQLPLQRPYGRPPRVPQAASAALTAAEALLPSAASEPWPPLGCRPTRPRAPSLPRQPRQPAARTGAWGKLGPLPGNGPVLPSPSNPHARTHVPLPLPLTQSKHRRMDRKRI